MTTETMKDAGFWTRLAPKYARDPIKDQMGYERSLEATRRLLKPTDTVLEIGCGTGTTALRLAGQVKRYLATDFAPGMIDIANAKSPPLHLDFETATLEEVARREERYDAIMAFNVLHLLRDVPGTLRQVHDLLRPGGLFISKTACLKNANVFIRLAVPPMQLFGFAPFVSVFSEAELRTAMEAADFEILDWAKHGSKGADMRAYVVARKPAG